jgi:hypothetical protein
MAGGAHQLPDNLSEASQFGLATGQETAPIVSQNSRGNGADKSTITDWHQHFRFVGQTQHFVIFIPARRAVSGPGPLVK